MIDAEEMALELLDHEQQVAESQALRFQQVDVTQSERDKSVAKVSLLEVVETGPEVVQVQVMGYSVLVSWSQTVGNVLDMDCHNMQQI